MKLNRRSFFGLAAITAITLAFTIMPGETSAAPQGPSTQVVFSGIGFADDGFRSRFGFWIWCVADGNGPYADATACAGSVYLYRINLTVGVHGYIMRNVDGTYAMHVHSNHPDLLSASLRNVSPELNPGPNNAVEFEVLTDQGVSSGEAPNSVVIVTGPPN
jgi:hypothetical protein